MAPILLPELPWVLVRYKTRATFLGFSHSSWGFAGPLGPVPTLLAPSGGLHQTTRSAGST